MPDQIDAPEAYKKRIAPYQGRGIKNPLGIERYNEIYENHRNPAERQLEFDVALWYGHLSSPLTDTQWKQVMVRRIFTLFAYGGLLVDKGRDAIAHNWQPWAYDQIPVCSAISHTARVMIWLPPGNAFPEFWSWLWAGHKPAGRALATHGVEQVPITEIYTDVHKGCRENKSKSSCNHYYVNLVLGGLGNIHPVSGNRIQDTGHHGHLYLALSKRKMHGRYALLISTEQSSPSDCETDAQGRRLYTNKISQLKRAVQGVPDQYGGSHALGGHSRFSSTGGDDFGYKTVRSALTDENYGPTRGHYIDGMYIDLTTPRFNFIKTLDFQNHNVSLTGIPPVEGIQKPGRQAPRAIPQVPGHQTLSEQPIAKPTLSKFFINDNKISDFLVFNLWLSGDGIADSALFCLCCREYRETPTKRKATFIFHTFLRRRMNTKRELSHAGIHEAILLVSSDTDNIAEKIFHQFKLYAVNIKSSQLKADLLHWIGAIGNIDSKISATLFDKALKATEFALVDILKHLNWTSMVDVAKTTASDMKNMRGGRTQNREGELKGYNAKHEKYNRLIQLMESSGFEKTPVFLKTALRASAF